ncbi:Copper chaperone [Handroanthus impetiginosus]|uniref:Copper chaperone n=1 Tax=Handroanthus impetiginosus TaxID=429701 RepID=A0A2G9H3A5_9LAMI|nr:Copper chaperone [Handroanthus impetiginosus]
MGEEEKKPAEEKKLEEAKKAAAEEKKEEAAPPKAEKSPEDGKKEEKKSEGEQPVPPPPPQEIVLRVFMHCEGCARKVRRCLKGFPGVEDVITDCRTSKVIVKGEKADPVKVFERVQRKSHRQVELISPIPKPPSEDPKKPEEKEVPKPPEKKEEPPVITVVLGVYMHCEACAQEIKKRIQRMKGVESAEPDLKSSQVTVKGVFEPQNLADYVYKRTGKHAVIIKVEPEKKEEKGKEGKEEKKPDEGNKEAKKGEEAAKEKQEGGSGEAAGGGSGGGEPPAKPEGYPEDPKLELRKNEFYYYYPQNYQLYPQRYIQEMNAYPPQIYGYPPQIFSDENPNACTVM